MDSWKKRKGKNTSCDVQVIMLCLRASESCHLVHGTFRVYVLSVLDMN